MPYIKKIPIPILMIVLGIIVARLEILPKISISFEIYNNVFNLVAPLTIFFSMLNVSLKEIRKLNIRIILYFLLGTIGTVLGGLVSMWIINSNISLGKEYYAIGGMYVGTYIGGTANLNAIAIHYKIINQSSLYTIINLIDNIATALWLGLTIILPLIFKRFFPNFKKQFVIENNIEETELSNNMLKINPLNITILLIIGYLCTYIAYKFSLITHQISSIVWQASISLVIAQIPFFNKMREKIILEQLYYYLLLFIIGTMCDLSILFQNGALALTLFYFVAILITIHAFVLFLVGYFFVQDWDILCVVSQANIGGASSSIICAKSIGRNDLYFLAVILSAFGNAIGTFIGIFVAEIFRMFF